MTLIRQEIRQVAKLDFPVLLRGETGTGKDLVARAIHRYSPRRKFPYLTLNMRAIPPNLAASELFGAVRGAFTGLTQDRPGLFREADKGVLFLDEIGDAPTDVQVLLLRALESGEIQPVGGKGPRRVDVRVISATDVNLESAVTDGRFRSPLLHRLSTYEIEIPPLRKRREDFGSLFTHFLQSELEEVRKREQSKSSVPKVPANLFARLALLPWPGNVRQLRNTVRQIVVHNQGRETLRVPPRVERLLNEELPPSAAEESNAVAPTTPPAMARPASGYRDADELSREEIFRALEANEWSMARAARALALARTSLTQQAQEELGLRPAAKLDREEIELNLKNNGGELKPTAHALRVSKRALKMRMRKLGMR